MKYLLISIAFLLVACQNKQRQTELPSSEKIYFDLTKIVQKDIDNNTINQCSEEKSVLINLKSETKNLDSIDWKKELQVLMDCDINKPGWKGKYDVRISDNQLKYTYTSNSSKIPVRKMTVNYEVKEGKIISVEVEKKIKTLLFTNEQQIIYCPEKSFKVKARQSAIFMKDFNSEVEIKYLCH